MKKTRDSNGNTIFIPEATSENIATIFRHDPQFKNIRFNVMRGWPETVDGNTRMQWTDADDAAARTYIEGRYFIANRAKTEDAFRVFLREREYNPVVERLEAIKWDGQRRCQSFLVKYAGAADTEYTRECSRLLFAGGINRAMDPGSKFDAVIVLVGAQGKGKSVLCSLLALEDDFFNSLKTIAGQRGYEGIAGKWVVELEELLAVIANDHSGQKIEEAAKAFLSARSDFYRKPYDRRPLDNPRRCIFIGTTNRETFLTDRTGNRRWYPVRCNPDPAFFFDHREAALHEIEQCWAEMLAAYKAGDVLASPTPDTALLEVIRDQQESAEVEDPRIGQIAEYLENKSCVCLAQIWRECLYRDHSNVPVIKRNDALELGEILVNRLGWERGKVARFGSNYGRQKAFFRPEKCP